MDITGEGYDGKLVNFTVENDCYVNNKIIGTTVAKKITVNILNPNNSLNLENKEISVFAGIDEEMIPFGNFIVEKPKNKEVQKKTSFTGYDYMIKFNITYKDNNKYPIKASTFFSNLCLQVGLEAGNLELINGDYLILGNPFTNNETCKEVLSALAQLFGGFAVIGRDNKVYIITLKQTDLVETIDGNNYDSSFQKNNTWGEVNSLVIRLSSVEGENTVREDQDSISTNGLTEIVIEDNPFLINAEEREKVIDNLWNLLKGIKYLPFTTDYYGYPYLDVGDRIKVLDENDIEYETYIFNHKFTYNGSFTGYIKTEALTKTQTAYKNVTDVKTKFKRVERSVDKINGRITDIIEEQSEYESKLTKVEQDIDSIKQTVENTAEYKRKTEGITQIHLTEAQQAEILMIEVQGNVTYESNLFPRANLYPSSNLLPNQKGG